jgi:hypothetical protein
MCNMQCILECTESANKKLKNSGREHNIMGSKRVSEANGEMKSAESIIMRLPNAEDVISEWFSQDHPDRLQKTCWRDHNQYREYHKTL